MMSNRIKSFKEHKYQRDLCIKEYQSEKYQNPIMQRNLLILIDIYQRRMESLAQDILQEDEHFNISDLKYELKP